MPWKDPEKNAEAVRRWREAHPGYWRRYQGRVRVAPISRYQVLDEDIQQQKALYSLSRRREDSPEAYRQRERRWIQATDFWSADGSRRANKDDG